MTDARWMAAALALAERGRARTIPNPNVGCVIVRDGNVVGRGWTQPGGRPHAEAIALAQAGELARGATAYVTLEPCAHQSSRGPSCTDQLVIAGIGRVVGAMTDPDPRTSGDGYARLKAAGIDVHLLASSTQAARRSMAGWLMRMERGRPFVTLKLATSLDGCIALANGESKWITGDQARAHVHIERSRHDAILVGRGTYNADQPKLDVRLPGLNDRSPHRLLLSSAPAPEGWTGLTEPEAIVTLDDVQYLLIEGGAQTAAAFLRAGLVDRLLFYRAPILIGRGTACLGDLHLTSLATTHGQWRHIDSRALGFDTLDVYERD